MYRQGDVLIRPIGGEVPGGKRTLRREDTQKRRRLVLASGEQTGHSHVIEASGDEAVLREREVDGEVHRFLEVLKPGGIELRHEEHDTITIPPGDYEIVRQREYSEQTPKRSVRVRD